MSAIITVGRFLEAAGSGRWDEAVEHTQSSWVQDLLDRGRRPSRELERAFTMLGVLEARIGGDARPPGPAKVAPLMLDVPVDLDTKFGGMQVVLRVIRELAPYQPSEHGRWGVHPASIRRTVQMRPAGSDDRSTVVPAQQVEWKRPPTGSVAASSL